MQEYFFHEQCWVNWEANQKSRRLAGLKPTPNELKDAKEQKRLQWNMLMDKTEREQEEGEKRKKADKEIRDDTEEYWFTNYQISIST